MDAMSIKRAVRSANLSREQVRRILQFLGYGRLSAPIWFIGLEEGLSSNHTEDFRHNLKARGAWDDVMDLERAHVLLNHDRAPIRIAIRPPSTHTWKWMGKICGELARQLGWGSRPDYREYVRLRLGRADLQVGETFLTELSPIPAKKIAENQHWKDSFRQIEPETDQIIQARLQRLSKMIQKMEPAFIICYGCETPSNRDRFKTLFRESRWQNAGEKSQISVSEDGRAVALVPFFGNGRLSTEECKTVIRDLVCCAQ